MNVQRKLARGRWDTGLASFRSGTRLVSLLAGALLITAAPSGRAETTDQGSQASTPSVPGLRIYVGMWSTHIRDIGRGLSNNWLVGLGWRGFYGGSFVNSFGNRSFTAGIQRSVARGADGAVVPSIGYRLGVLSGYDERFMSIASKTPVLPLAQVVGGLESGRTGVELGYAGLVATLGPSFRF
ncbi:MAG: hypothetical protein HY560_09340 [Gemmatimonadetes bacterium]|nr:hypothetical protein [Gemmatimonadota bacterium]